MTHAQLPGSCRIQRWHRQYLQAEMIRTVTELPAWHKLTFALKQFGLRKIRLDRRGRFQLNVHLSEPPIDTSYAH